MKVLLFLILSFFIGASCNNAAKDAKTKSPHLAGHFMGHFEYKGKRLNASIDFDSVNGKQTAFLSVPDNLQLQKPFTTVEYAFPNIKLTMQDGETPLIITAVVNDTAIDGKLSGDIPATLHLTKVENYQPPAKNYVIEEITLNNQGIKLHGKLYLPKSKSASPAVIMVSGSGDHTKEEYNGAADLFSSKGIATLTFDKRNVTTPGNLKLRHINSDIATMKELISDVEVFFYYLQTKKEIVPNKIGVMGFSLGAVEVPVVAANNPGVAFIIAVSGNATTDKEFIINQGLNKLKEKGYDSVTLQKAIGIYERLFAYPKNRLNKESLQSELDKAFQQGWGQWCFPGEVPNEDELNHLLAWNNYQFDPATYWEKVNVPCLVVYGENDQQIPVKRSVEILDKVFEKKKHLLTLKVYPNAGHTIRQIPQKEFEFPSYADNYINGVVNWLMQQR